MSMPSAVRLRWSNRVKCLVCYLVCFALPLLWQAAASLWIYPLKLTGTAPNVALHLQAALPFSPAPLDALARSGEAVAATPEALRAALFSREQSWLWFLAACALAAWLITLAVQLLWRAGRRSAIQPARAARRAIRTYRLTLLWLCAVNAAFAAVVWLAGVRWIPGRTGWDLAAYFGCYALNVLAAAAVSRLAAPPAISGRHAFFKRL